MQGGDTIPMTTAGKLERILREEFAPERLDIRDDSALHAGHPGATSGGGHYHVVLVSSRFVGLSRVEQHRRVYEALDALIPGEIHALGLKTAAP